MNRHFSRLVRNGCQEQNRGKLEKKVSAEETSQQAIKMVSQRRYKILIKLLISILRKPRMIHEKYGLMA